MIRPVQTADREELARMRTALWPDSEATEVEGVLTLEQPVGIVLVAERSANGLMGFAEVGTRPFAEGCRTTPVAYLEGIWVDGDSRRTGVAQALVRHAEAWARAQGLTEFASDCEIENTASQAFHGAAGFVEVQRNISFKRDLGVHPG